MSPLAIFSLFAIAVTLGLYAQWIRARWAMLAFAGACALCSIEGFVEIGWPLGVIGAIWGCVALRRYVLA